MPVTAGITVTPKAISANIIYLIKSLIDLTYTGCLYG